MASKAEQAEKKERKEAPLVRTRNRGQISGTLERFAEVYRAQYPDRDVRYIYDPTHKPELSGIMGRKAMGYEIVTYGQIGEVGDEQKEKEPVRVGDLVLMSIDKKTKQAIVAERQGWARERARSVERAYYNEIEQAADKATPSHHSGPAARPLGRAVIEEREFEYERKQRED